MGRGRLTALVHYPVVQLLTCAVSLAIIFGGTRLLLFVFGRERGTSPMVKVPSSTDADSLQLLLLVQIADPHIGEPGHDDVPDRLRAFFAGELAHLSPARLVITGDITDSPRNTDAASNERNWVLYKELLTDAGLYDRSKVLEVPGNHDLLGVNSYADPMFLYCKYAVASQQEECRVFREYQAAKNGGRTYNFDLETERSLRYTTQRISTDSGCTVQILLVNTTPLPNYGHLFGYYGLLQSRDADRLQELMGSDMPPVNEDTKKLVSIGFQHHMLHQICDRAHPYKIVGRYSEMLHNVGLEAVFSGHVHKNISLQTRYSVPDISLDKFSKRNGNIALITIDTNTGLISHTPAFVDTYPIISVINPPDASLFNRAPVANQLIVAVTCPPALVDPNVASQLISLRVRSADGMHSAELAPVGKFPVFMEAPRDKDGIPIGTAGKNKLPILVYSADYIFEERGVLVLDFEVDPLINEYVDLSRVSILYNGSVVVPYSSTVAFSRNDFRASYPPGVVDTFHPYPGLNSLMFSEYLGSYVIILTLFTINLITLVLLPAILQLIAKIQNCKNHAMINTNYSHITLLDALVALIGLLNISLYFPESPTNSRAISIFDTVFTGVYAGKLEASTDSVLGERKQIAIKDTGTIEIGLIVTCVTQWGFQAARLMSGIVRKSAMNKKNAVQMSFVEGYLQANSSPEMRKKIPPGSKSLSSTASSHIEVQEVDGSSHSSSQVISAGPYVESDVGMISPNILTVDQTTTNNQELNKGRISPLLCFCLELFFLAVVAMSCVVSIVLYFALYNLFTYISLSALIEILYVIPEAITLIVRDRKYIAMRRTKLSTTKIGS